MSIEDQIWKRCISTASFWRPELRVESAWLTHAPFAFWLIEATRPKVLVELGTHRGFSYAAFCQAIERLGCDSRCYAIDSWQGDEHAGFYGEDVFADFAAYHDRRYAQFSSLLRMTFDQGLEYFDNGSIDLLHIDGRHRYEDVKHDFERWYPKLSDRAIVLFHDTNVRERGFGVYRFWAELSGAFPRFEFAHGYGLGILGVGARIPESATALFECSSLSAQARCLGQVYSRLGEAVRDEWVSLQKYSEATALISQLQAETGRLTGEIDRVVKSSKVELAARSQALSEERTRAETLAQALQARDREVNSLRASTSWRVTKPLRSRFAQAVYALVRKAIRSIVRGWRGRLAWRPIRMEASGYGAASRQLRVVFLSGEPETPGHIYRIERNAAAARYAGAHVSIEVVHRFDIGKIVANADIIWLWRVEWTEHIEQLLNEAERRGVKIVFDVDDLMIDPTLARPDVIDAIRSQGLVAQDVAGMYARVASTFARADYGVAPTDFLAQYMRKYQKPAVVLKNTFDESTLAASRLAVRRLILTGHDGLERIGYAGGTRTHQQDFARAVGGIVRVLQERPQSRLVLFTHGEEPIVKVNEYPELEPYRAQIEWRAAVSLRDLPEELVRFDINLAPLVPGNPFCEAKSELKYFEAALVDVPTIASPTKVFADAIKPGITGFLAETEDDWYRSISELLNDRCLRAQLGRTAFYDALWRYGPEQQADEMGDVLNQVAGNDLWPGRSVVLDSAHAGSSTSSGANIPENTIIFQRDQLGTAEVCIVVPLHNYEKYIVDALQSVADQTLKVLDLVVVDDVSTDNSLEVAHQWIERHADRFNRVLLCQNRANAGLALTRNAGFARAEARFILPLDADNVLLPSCAEGLLQVISESNAAFVYPQIQKFGESDEVIGIATFDPNRLAIGNYIDAMALVRKAAWAEVGGYDHIQFGWEDYDFWCKFIEHGLRGRNVPQILARYRVHVHSMLSTQTDIPQNKRALIAELKKRHPWLKLPSV